MASSASLCPLSFSVSLYQEAGSAKVTVYNLSSLTEPQRELFIQNLNTQNAHVRCQEVFSKTLFPGETTAVRKLNLGTEFLFAAIFGDKSITHVFTREGLHSSRLNVSSTGISIIRDQSSTPTDGLRRSHSAGALDDAFAYSPLVTSDVGYGVRLDSNGQPVTDEKALEALLNEAMNEGSGRDSECSSSLSGSVKSTALSESDVEEPVEEAKEETSIEEPIMEASGGLLDEIMKDFSKIGNNPMDHCVVEIPPFEKEEKSQLATEEVSDDEEMQMPSVSESPGLPRENSGDPHDINEYPYDENKTP